MENLKKLREVRGDLQEVREFKEFKGVKAICLVAFSMIVSYIINRIINHYIVKQLGGTTGDTYGFVVEVTEVLLILVYIITLTLLSSVVKAPIL